MNNDFHHLRITGRFLFLAAICGVIGCSGIDRVGRNMDIASEHISTDKPVYEGKLQSVKRVGALTALQFSDGQSFEVVECQAPLVPGDVVRIHKLEKGYVAHLWIANNTSPPVPSNVLTTQPPGPPPPPSNK